MKRILPALIILFFLSCHGDRNILLRLKYDRGQSIDIKYRNYVYNDNDVDDPIKNEYLRLGFSIDSVTRDSSYVFAVKIDYVRVKNSGLMAEDYSSDKDEKDMGPAERRMHMQFKPILDSVFKFTVSKRGQLIKPFAFAGGTKIPPQYALIDLGIYQITFPEEKIAIGDKWTNEYPMPGVNAKRICTYHIESIRNSEIHIGVSGEIQLASGDSKDFTGSYVLDQSTKKLISGKIEMEARDGFGSHLKAVVSVEAH